MNLLEYRSDTYTTIGNDGIIEKIFDIIGVKQGNFIEFGAWDGIHGCNCRKLAEEGWSGVFIEPVLYRYLHLKWNYRKYKDILKIKSFVDPVGRYSLDNIVSDGKKYDFISIDVDGLDITIFEKINQVLPKVFCIEGGQMLEPFSGKVPEEIERKNVQQSLSVISDIARRKGYKIVCSYQDTFLVKEEYSNLFPVSDDLRQLYYDGLKASYRRLPWIQHILSGTDIKNRIVDEVLTRSNFDSYGFERRKEWAIDIKGSIEDIIDEVYTGFNV